MESNQFKILRLPDVKARVGLGRDSIYRLIRDGDFPAQIKISARASGWIESEIDAFVTSRIAARDGGAS